jgi:hypothetical protein
MGEFWAEMGVAYLEINKLPCLHEIDIGSMEKKIDFFFVSPLIHVK